MNWYSHLFYLFSVISAIPFTLVVIYRGIYRDPLEKHPKYIPPSYHLDTAFRVFLIPYLLYYVTDSAVLIYLYRDMDMCNLAFLLHHVFSIIGFPWLVSIPYYPWFLMAPVVYHCYLVWFPLLLWLNYGYLTLAFIMFYNLLQRPWINYRKYRVSLIVALGILAVPLVMLWWFDCVNDMENTVLD